MKNKFTARLCVLMCIILAISCFTACKVKPDNTDSTTLAGGDSWQSDSGYNKVVISQAELVDLVEDALGDEMPENFNGDLSTLTPEQLEKVENHAKDEGLTVEKDDNGDTVIKKEEIPVTEASKDEVEDLFNKLSIKDPSNLSDKEYEELSKAANDEGLIVSTKPDGDLVIVKPVTTTRIITQASPDNTTKKPTPPKTTKGTTSVYKPPQHMTAAPMGSSTELIVSTLSDGWITNFGGGKHTVLVDNAVAKDGGTVAVGVTSDETASNMGVVVKYNEKGKQQWKNTVTGNELVSLDSIAVLTDGSVVVVGSTLATDLTSSDNYMCLNTVEGVVIKYSAKGEKQWLKIIGGSGGDIIYAVEATPDGGFVIGGKTTSKDGHFSGLSDMNTKAFVMKLTADGNPQWKTCLAGTIHCAVRGLAVNSAGEVFATMENNNTDGDFAQFNLPGTRRMAVISKISSSGKIQWSKPLYESGLTNMHGITYTDDGGCVVAGQYSATAKEGNIYSFKKIYNGGTGGTYDGVIVKFKSDGSTSWVTPLIGFESDYITDITRISNGYAVCGYSASSNRNFQSLGKGDYDAFIYTLNNYGETEKIYSLSGSAADNARSICASGDLLYVSGSTNSSDGAFEGLSPAGTADEAAGVLRCYKLS